MGREKKRARHSARRMREGKMDFTVREWVEDLGTQLWNHKGLIGVIFIGHWLMKAMMVLLGMMGAAL